MLAKGIILYGTFRRCENHDDLAEELVRNEQFRSRYEQDYLNPLDFLIFRCNAVKIGNEWSPISQWVAVYSSNNLYAERWIAALEEKEMVSLERMTI